MTELQEAVAQAATIIIPDDMLLSSDAEGALIPVRYCSAPCGSGKTFQALKMAHELARRGKRVLLVQPTVELNEKSRIELEEKFSTNVQCRVFNTETCGRGNVAAELSKYAKKLPRRSEIVLSTHQILPFMDGFEGKGNWHLVVDEQLQAFQFDERSLPKNYKVITEHLSVEPYNAIYSRISVIDPDEFSALVKNRNGDEVVEFLHQTFMTLANRHNDTFVNIERYRKLVSGGQSFLTMYSVLRPSIIEDFGSVIMVAANSRRVRRL